jgi:hypothetical protein
MFGFYSGSGLPIGQSQRDSGRIVATLYPGNGMNMKWKRIFMILHEPGHQNYQEILHAIALYPYLPFWRIGLPKW